MHLGHTIDFLIKNETVSKVHDEQVSIHIQESPEDNPMFRSLTMLSGMPDFTSYNRGWTHGTRTHLSNQLQLYREIKALVIGWIREPTV